MTARRRPEWPPPLSRYLVALGLIGAVVVVAYFAYTQRIPFVDGYRVQAVVESSSGLRQGSPVRIAGADVGRVAEMSKGPGHTTTVTLEIDEDGRPIHRDATVRIRPRVFLEGGYAVELRAGSPSAPELPDGGVIPLGQTARPVQFHDFLGVFDRNARADIRSTFDTFARALDDGGAEGLRALAPELAPVLRDTAIVAEASTGTQQDDLARLVAATAKVSAALDEDPAKTGRLVDHLATVAAALDRRGPELAATLRQLDALVDELPAATGALDAALPVVERAARQISPALDIAPATFRELTREVSDLGDLVKPGARERTLAGLETAFVDLPDLVGRLARVFPAGKQLSDCLSSHVVPTFESVVPDGALSSGRPAWQDFAHAVVGLAGGSQNFDGNGHALRYQFGIGDQSFSTAVLPGLGQVLANAPSSLQSRPLPRADGQLPPYRSDVPCTTQPRVKLETPAGPAGLSPAPGVRAVEPLTAAELRKVLQRDRLRKLLRRAKP